MSSAYRQTAPVAVSVSGPHAMCSFFSICVSLGEEPEAQALVSDAVATEALSILTRLAKSAPAGTVTLNPIRLLETMATSDDIALVPLIYGYVNYARLVPGRHRVAFADAPVARAGGRHGSVLGGTGIAVTKRTKPDSALLDHLRWLMSEDTQVGFIPEHEGQPSRGRRGGTRGSIATPGTSIATPWRRWRRPGCVRATTATSRSRRKGRPASARPSSTARRSRRRSGSFGRRGAEFHLPVIPGERRSARGKGT